jgi:lipoprotein-anchoring transpeptidase ErfK/SrfK
LKVPNVTDPFHLQKLNRQLEQRREQREQEQQRQEQREQQEQGLANGEPKQQDGSNTTADASTENGAEQGKHGAGGDTETPQAEVPEAVQAMREEVPEPEVLDDPRIEVDKAARTLTLYDGDRVVAFAPITPGAAGNPAPAGDWELVAVAWMPTFRYDEDMLEDGRRSDDYHIYPPGPNNPVGVIWMSINSKGIGLHGTAYPGSIGRSASHGCVRMSNWDAWSIGRRVKPGMPVIIR